MNVLKIYISCKVCWFFWNMLFHSLCLWCNLFSLLYDVTVYEYASLITPFAWQRIFSLGQIFVTNVATQKLPLHISQAAYLGAGFLGVGSSSPESPSLNGVALWKFWLLGGILRPPSPLPRIAWVSVFIYCFQCLIIVLLFLQAQLWILKEVCYILSYIYVFQRQVLDFCGCYFFLFFFFFFFNT